MVDEKQEVTTEAVVEPVEQKEDDLRTQLTALTQERDNLASERDASREEAKKHQSNLSKKAEELSRKQAAETNLSNLSSKVDILANMMAEVVDSRENYDEEQPKRRRSTDYLSKLSELNKPTPDASQQEYNALAQEADDIIRTAGLEMNKSPELRQAYLLFRVGDAQAGLEETRKVVEVKKIEAAKVPDRKELTEDEEAEIARKYLEKKGTLKTETGGPSTGFADFKAKEKAYGRGEIPYTEYSEARKKANLD